MYIDPFRYDSRSIKKYRGTLDNTTITLNSSCVYARRGYKTEQQFLRQRWALFSLCTGTGRNLLAANDFRQGMVLPLSVGGVDFPFLARGLDPAAHCPTPFCFVADVVDSLARREARDHVGDFACTYWWVSSVSLLVVEEAFQR